MWFVTGFDDVVLERFLPHLRRGEYAEAFRIWGRILTGWWGCAVIPLLIAAVVAILALG